MKLFHSAYLAACPGPYLHGDHGAAVDVPNSAQIEQTPRLGVVDQRVLHVPTHLVPVQKVQPLRAGHHRHVGGDIQRRLGLLGRLGRWILADGAEGAEKLEEGHGDAREEAELRTQRHHAHDAHDERPEIAA